MTNHLVTVTCPLSVLHDIAEALSWAEHRASFRADIIMHLEALHNDDPKSPAGYLDTIDDVKHYREDAEQFKRAHDLAFNLWATSSDVTDPEAIAFYDRWHTTDADAPQAQAVSLSEFIPF